MTRWRARDRSRGSPGRSGRPRFRHGPCGSWRSASARTPTRPSPSASSPSLSSGRSAIPAGWSRGSREPSARRGPSSFRRGRNHRWNASALTPDLILATNHYRLADHHDLLRRIAPVLAYVNGPNADTWQTTTRRIGRALGRQAQAERLVRDLEDRLGDVRRRATRLRGRTFTFSSFAGDQVVTKCARDDVLVRFLAGFGLALPALVAALPESGPAGMAGVSRERLELIDAGYTLITFRDEHERRAIETTALFARLNSVRNGGYLPLTPAESHALAFPSVLSIPYAIDRVLPRLNR
ncbi:ABC transporter substrate-binding protein [Thermocatellispora tengchongensis]|uniref:ABC transporter substrate-binding protein n=1 Tax=Thermocatellispora tengchongensis TaxID=1073253 RepID=UPI0031EA2F8E